MSKKRIALISIGAILVIGGIIRSKTKAPVEATKVEVLNVVVKKTVSASGSVTSTSEIDLSLPAAGQLENLLVSKGDDVVKGQLLGNVYNYDSSQSAQSLRDAADVANRDLDIYIENYATNLSAAGGLDEYNLNVKRLRELANKAEASYQSSLGSLSKTILYSPIDGTVIDTYIDVGEVATAGTSILKLADLKNLVFEISVDQEDFGLLKIGQPVEVILDSYSGTIFRGVVSELPKYADADSEEFEVKITLTASDDKPVLLGMKGDASIIIESTLSEVRALDFDVVFYNGEESPHIWVNKNGKLTKVDVETGLEGDIYTEIKTDISEYELVSPKGDEIEGGAKIKLNDK